MSIRLSVVLSVSLFAVACNPGNPPVGPPIGPGLGASCAEDGKCRKGFMPHPAHLEPAFGLAKQDAFAPIALAAF